MLSDVEIIRRVKKGKSDEFRELVARHQRSALTLAYRMLGNWDDAEDAAQDAFVNAFRSLDGFSEAGHFWPWFRVTVVNCCIRRMSHRVPTEDIDTLLDSAQPFVDSAESEALKRRGAEDVRTAISGLPPEYRSVVVLRYQEGYSTSEIAEALEVSPGAVRVKLHRALKMLAERLAVIEVEL
ncbi:MAG: sigma-70 family RNA polymerase sigma factor [Armatimonadota bacterium]|nr:sigma-70 family RNA polymerase sigma factor [Armatimonadota bacterium]